MFVVASDPDRECPKQLRGTRPFPEPQALFFERTNEALGIGVSFGVIVAGKGLVDPQGAAGLHEGERRGLAAVITPQRPCLISSGVRELAVNRLVQRFQPRLGGALDAGIVAHDHLRGAIAHHPDRDPAEALHQHRGHLEAPLHIGPGRLCVHEPFVSEECSGCRCGTGRGIDYIQRWHPGLKVGERSMIFRKSSEEFCNGSVIVAHPGTQYSYETVLAVQEAELLQWYITGFFYKPEGLLGRWVRLFPDNFRFSLERELCRRYKDGLDPNRVRT